MQVRRPRAFDRVLSAWRDPRNVSIYSHLHRGINTNGATVGATGDPEGGIERRVKTDTDFSSSRAVLTPLCTIAVQRARAYLSCNLKIYNFAQDSSYFKTMHFSHFKTRNVRKNDLLGDGKKRERFEKYLCI